ncbi:AcrR family transcriptional regulator [Spinactinospora alkalitolerans]|uniref:AcrR family transcriptional regulator n=1 Tax=Spinactinospora alkalitolerans TaxID=687207 RepID=A0A852TLC9_9ACTN|nr:TetR family transcriptional regulator [Spinactinospora alkalitolerans]NYE45036.1 AcrR family transcriptional regulator [Spinactinospora alkalitolerans]
MDRPDTVETCADRVRVRDREATRQRILDSARELFTSDGYAQVSSRTIASHAGVNVALINRYFGAKRGLLAEVIAEEAVFPGIFEGEPATLPRRLAEHLVCRAKGGATPLQRALERSAGDPDLQAVYEERLRSALLEPLTRYLDGPDARVRASLVVTVLMGMGLLRRVEGATALAEHDAGDLTERLTRIISACLADSAA